MPIFSLFYFLFLLSNFGFPGTSNFVGEFFILVGGFDLSNVIILLSSIGLVLSLIYSLCFYNRVFFGSFPIFIRYYCDCTKIETFGLFVFLIFVLVLGFFPNLIFSFSIISLKKLLLLFFNF